mmetsp:Transcript_29667/g.78168  ORF Transcript_29667/g.78168 Transcript_29667/m.78168 type:complete len:116 (-) Transcript_29667:1-348(-)
MTSYRFAFRFSFDFSLWLLLLAGEWRRLYGGMVSAACWEGGFLSSLFLPLLLRSAPSDSKRAVCFRFGSPRVPVAAGVMWSMSVVVTSRWQPCVTPRSVCDGDGGRCSSRGTRGT